MQTSDTIVLIENPLTGNDSFAKALKLTPDDAVPKWITPDAARKEWKGWDDKEQHVVLVRDPQSRFESGVALAFSLLEQSPEDRLDMPEDFVAHLKQFVGVGMTPEQRALAVLEYLKGDGEVPVFLQPQRNWLTSKFDLVLATHHIAEFFNQEGKVCCVRSNRFNTGPGSIRAHAGGEKTRALFAEVFKDDIDFLSRLIVWSPDPEKVRLVSGYCVECANKRKKTSDGEVELIDLHDRANDGNGGGEDAPADDEAIADVEPPKKTARTRSRNKVDK